MKREELGKLFSWYRSIEVEPIPLIQSLGHMGWLFGNGNRTELAVNGMNPYTIDPRKPGSKELIGKVWDEAIELLHPKTIHVGLDEIDMLGFPTKDPELSTELWRSMVPYLGSVAQRNNVKLMLWGDEGLAASEAIDATNGNDKVNAVKRRKAIPAGAMIADWHYKADQNHVPFLKSLQLWKLEGFRPIASSWYRPENVRGFGVAADVEKVGTLQTTWAGYESSEKNMLKNINQFSALILAGDYSWSGRLEKIEELPYDPIRVLGKMYNPHQSPTVPNSVRTIGTGKAFLCGGIKFGQLESAVLRGISNKNMNSPESTVIALSGIHREIAVALSCEVQAEKGENIGEIVVNYRDGTQDKSSLIYGLHVLAGSESGSTFFGERSDDHTCLRLNVKEKELKSVKFKAGNRYSGLQIDGVTLVPLRGKKSPS
jgi:hypothetical protein